MCRLMRTLRRCDPLGPLKQYERVNAGVQHLSPIANPLSSNTRRVLSFYVRSRLTHDQAQCQSLTHSDTHSAPQQCPRKPSLHCEPDKRHWHIYSAVQIGFARPLNAGGLFYTWTRYKAPNTMPNNESLSPYKSGEAAAKRGDEHWTNPYSGPKGLIPAHQAWYAGWCFGKQSLV